MPGARPTQVLGAVLEPATGAHAVEDAELLAKAKVGTTINSGDIILGIDNDGKGAPQLALDIRRGLGDLSMAAFGRTDRWGQT
jgi:hypothetical protein